MLTILQENGDAVTALFTVVLAFSTIVLAFLTGMLAVETRRLRRASTEPELVAYLLPDRRHKTIVNFEIANIGQGAAKDIRFRFIADPDDFTRHEVRLAAEDKARRIAVLPQNERLSTLFAQGFELFKDTPLKPFTVAVRHRASKKEELFHLDVSDFKGLVTVGVPADHEMAEALKKIERTLDSWSSGFKRLKVETSTPAEEEERRRKTYEAMRGRDSGDTDRPSR
jgi:hypothetical protein